MSVQYVRPNCPYVQNNIHQSFQPIAQFGIKFVEYDSDWLLVGFTFYLILVF